MPVLFLVQRHPILTHLCSGNKECLHLGPLGEGVVPRGRLIPTKPLWDIPCQSEASWYATNNSGWVCERKVSFCTCLSRALLPFWVVDFALGWDRWQLQGLCCCISVSAEPAAVIILHEGSAAGAGAFPRSSASLLLSPRTLPQGSLMLWAPGFSSSRVLWAQRCCVCACQGVIVMHYSRCFMVVV